jgi:polyphosphate kinase 2 (PPK2 family)
MLSKKLLFNAHNNAKLLVWDPDNTFNRNPKDLETGLTKLFARMSELQYRMYVEKKTLLLIILQGMDTSGKDGTIRHVITAFHPISCRVESFKIPSTDELAHDFLWRIHKVVPQRGFIGVFNRSHYEDIIEVRVQNLVPHKVWSQRYDQINQFERYMAENNVKVVKFFLHISKQEQKKRLLERLSDP